MTQINYLRGNLRGIVKMINKFKNKNKNKKGFTLLEAILSIALFIILGVLVATIIVSANKYTLLSREIDKDKAILSKSISKGGEDIDPKNLKPTEKNDIEIKYTLDGEDLIVKEGEFIKSESRSGRTYSTFVVK